MKVKAKKIVYSEYHKALDFLYGFIDYERDFKWKYDDDHFDLSRVRKLLNALGNPHEKGRFVHIAGTNGKGSVAAMISSALMQSGYKTGLYTSPHLVTFRERIKINDSLIPRGDVVYETGLLKSAVNQIEGLTFFEVWTVLAFDYFARKSVDVSVIEVGMGGRLDTTNVISPAVSVITSISMDHLGKLGNTIEKIAYEKAGIIKPDIPVVSAPQNDEVLQILEEKAEEVKTKFICVGREVNYTVCDDSMNYNGIDWKLNDLHIPLAGTIQLENAAVALAALETVSSEGYSVTPRSARKGVESVRWPGRLHTVSEKPEVIVDGACNIGAMKTVRDYVLGKKSKDNVVAVISMCRDKDVDKVLGIAEQMASRFVFTEVNNPRIMPACELAVRSLKEKNTFIEADPFKAVQKSISLAGSEGLVIITGSLYLVGEVLRYYSMGTSFFKRT